jgi:hypothetical protein
VKIGDKTRRDQDNTTPRQNKTKARQGKTRQDKARQDKTRQDKKIASKKTKMTEYAGLHGSHAYKKYFWAFC